MNLSKKSIEKITQVLLQGMEDGAFQELTISELCKRAGVARKTFYNHFKTKEEVLSRVCSSIIDEYMKNPNGEVSFDRESWLEELAHLFFEVNQKHQLFLILLFHQNLFHIYTQELQRRVINSEYITNQYLYSKLSPSLHPFVIPTYTASILTVYEIWYHRGFVESPEEMAEIYLNIVQRYG